MMTATEFGVNWQFLESSICAMFFQTAREIAISF